MFLYGFCRNLKGKVIFRVRFEVIVVGLCFVFDECFGFVGGDIEDVMLWLISDDFMKVIGLDGVNVIVCLWECIGFV